MTTLWADGFDDTTIANLSADYAFSGSTMTIDGGRRAGSSALTIPNTSTINNISRSFGATPSTLFLSCAMYVTNYNNSSARSMIRFMEGSVQHLSLYVNTNGQIVVWRGSEGGTETVLLTTASAPFPLNTWAWFQIKLVIHSTTGSIEIRDAGGNVLGAASNINTRNTQFTNSGYVDTVQAGRLASTSGGAFSIDDLHIWDTTGSICNTWTNDTRIDSKLPTGAGDATQFTASAGANWQCVDDPTFSATDYVSSSTAGHQDLYAVSDLSHNPPTIFGVMRSVVGQKDDAGARNLKMLTKSGTTVNTGSAKSLSQGAYTRVFDILETDPNTGAAWTQTGFNAAQFGFENV